MHQHQRLFFYLAHTVAVVILALFPPVLLVVSVLLRFLALGRRVAPGTTAVTLLLGIARLLRLVMFVRAHDSGLSYREYFTRRIRSRKHNCDVKFTSFVATFRSTFSSGIESRTTRTRNTNVIAKMYYPPCYPSCVIPLYSPSQIIRSTSVDWLPDGEILAALAHQWFVASWRETTRPLVILLLLRNKPTRVLLSGWKCRSFPSLKFL